MKSAIIEPVVHGGSRRDFIARFAALGLIAITRPQQLNAQTETSISKRLIDVHHHFIPPFYFSDNRERIAAAAGGRMHPAYASWSCEQSIAAMDQQSVATAVLSLTTPGVWFGDPKTATRTARRVNEYAANLVRTYPGRFGFFAAIPLPDTQNSLREIDYAFTELRADGIGLMTSYDDRWLGDSAYKPVLEELNRRSAVVFVHPTTGLCCRTLLPDVNPIMLEIPQDTTRAITNLLFSGTLSKFRNIRFIFAHAGGSLPMVLGRLHQYAPKNIAETLPDGIDHELKRLYYDIAGTAYRPAIAALTNFVSTTQIVFGSDHPFIPLAETAEGVTQLSFSASDLRRIGRDNVLALLPGLQTS
jgi:predicted TIM-barrel fold metal-dependent hydrolase